MGSWPGQENNDPVSATIVIMDKVEVEDEIVINGSKYPPIVFTDEKRGGTLQALSSIHENGKFSLLELTNSTKVTLEGSLILAGTGVEVHHIRG
jgi:hypothetical protein